MTRIHMCTAALLAAVAGLLTLAVIRYGDAGQERRAATFEALAGSIRLAAAVAAPASGPAADRLADEAALFPDRQRLHRVFFVRKGRRIEALDISQPARIEADTRFPGFEEAPSEDEKILTLCARLDREARAGALPGEVEPHALAWRKATGSAPVVAAWPVFASGAFVGLAGLEMAPVPLPPSPIGSAALIWAAFLALFAAGLAIARRPRALFAALSVLAAAAAFVPLHARNQRQAGDLLLRRDLAVTTILNRLPFSATEFLPPRGRSPSPPEAGEGGGGLAALAWTDVFKSPPDGLSVLSAPPALVAFEPDSVAADVALDRTLGPMVVLLLLLALGVALFSPVAVLSQGLARMPGVYAYVAPAMAGMVVLVLIPFLMGVGLGFFNAQYEFVGVDNFRDILFPSAESDTNFYFTLGVTVLWTASNVFLHVAIGLFLALVLVGEGIRARGLFRVLLIVPWAIPNYITALIWKWMFTSQVGAVNLMLEAVGMAPVSWFGPNFWTNFFAALATNTWLGFPFMMVVSMGALQSIPAELYEAADMDGASRWQKFRHITLPLLKPALFPAVILGTIWTFNMFNIIYLVTRGNPDNKTNILITEAYRFFAELNQYGVAAAYCVLIFVILFLYTLITNRVTRATQGAFE